MIHQYKLGGYNIVLDICSGSVHVVDEVAYDIIALFESESREAILAQMDGAAVPVQVPSETTSLPPDASTMDPSAIPSPDDPFGFPPEG